MAPLNRDKRPCPLETRADPCVATPPMPSSDSGKPLPIPSAVHAPFVIGNAIVDFACRKARLVVELDGGQHADSDEAKLSTEILALAGWRVIRFWNHDVLQNSDGVMEVIVSAVAERLPEGAHPQPLPEIREGRTRQRPQPS